MHSQHDIKILSNLTTRNKKTNPCNSIHEQQQETLQQTRTKHNTLPPFFSHRIISQNTPTHRQENFPFSLHDVHLISASHPATSSSKHSYSNSCQRQEYTRDFRKRRKENKILDSYRIGFLLNQATRREWFPCVQERKEANNV